MMRLTAAKRPSTLIPLAALLILGLVVVVTVTSCGDDKSATPSATVAGALSTPGNVAGTSPASAERLVATYFYYWYDLPDGPHSAPLTDHPADPGTSYESVDWFKRQLADMSYAGIDIALPAYWWFSEPSSGVGLINLSDAYDQLVAEGQSPPSIGMFLDTGAIGQWPLSLRDLTVPLNQERVYQMIRSYFTIVPERQWATIDGRPVVWLWAAYFDIKYDRSFFDYVISAFDSEFGVRPYLVGEEIWRYAHTSSGVDYSEVMPLDDFYIWGASANGFAEPTGGIAEVGPGYDERTLPGPGRIGRYQDREDGQFYVENFEKAIESGSAIIAIETWNEFHEASDVAESVEYGRQYIELTRQLVNSFKAIDSEPSPSPTLTPSPGPGTSPPTAPTATPTATPVPSPSPVPSPVVREIPTPTATPTRALATGGWLPPLADPNRGDINCDGDIDSTDALKLLRHVSGFPGSVLSGCPGIGSQSTSIFGDIDCDRDVDSVDALRILRHVAGLPVSPSQNCTPIGLP